MSVFDLTFVLCAVAFNFLIIGIYITSRHELVGLRSTPGKIDFPNYITGGKVR